MTEYVIILSYSTGELIKIKLTEQESALAAETENFEEFLQTLESKYGFKVGQCYWMYTPALIERNFNF